MSLLLLLKQTSSASCEKMKLSHKSRIGSVKEELAKRPEPEFNWSLFFELVLPDLWLFVLATLSAFGAALVNIQLPILLGQLVNSITVVIQESSDPELNVFGELYEPCKQLIWNYIMQAGLTFGYITLLSSFGERLAARLRSQLFTALLTQDIAFFDKHKTGEVVSR